MNTEAICFTFTVDMMFIMTYNICYLFSSSPI